MNPHHYAVIMAGGGGTRLWPVSRKARPKQMLQLTSQRTLFQIAVDRLEGLFPSERILVVTVEEQALELRKQCPQIPSENYLIEPMPRGTASVVGLAAIALNHRDPKASMVILTADHFIQQEAYFRSLLKAALEVADQGYLVTLGIKPHHPATGYGYIQQGESLGKFSEFEAFRAIGFKEKPDLDGARSFIEQGDHAWNSGMFIWRVDRIMAELDQLMPQLTEIIQKIASVWETDTQNEVLQELWPSIRPETIDYGIMEKADQVAVLPADNLGWNDVGSWDSLFDVLPLDETGNIVTNAHHVGIDTDSSLIFGQDPERLIVTIDAQDMVIIDTKDALLICPKDSVQKVRTVVEHLKKTGQQKYL
jgi:mannose-1-phosphate guanylyltransferase